MNSQGPLIMSDYSMRSVVARIAEVLILRISFAMVRFSLRLSGASGWTSVVASLKPSGILDIRILDERQLLLREKIEKDGC